MTTIFNAEPSGYAPGARAILQELGEVIEREVDRQELLALLPGVDVLMVRLSHEIDREALATAPRLRAIVTATTGLDHIDTSATRRRGIAIISLKGETEFLRTIPATAEYTWALLLALVRRVPSAVASTRGGTWSRSGLLGSDLRGRRLGIVGVGRIGRMVARIGHSFAMDVAGFDPFTSEEWPPEVERAADLESLLRRSDVLTLHVPLNESTEGLLGARELAWLPPGAIVVNTARGALVDESALAHALDSGSLGGAALDVLRHEREPALRNASPLLAYAVSHDNLLVTPHIGGFSEESLARAEVFVAEKLAAWLRASPAAAHDHVEARGR